MFGRRLARRDWGPALVLFSVLGCSADAGEAATHSKPDEKTEAPDPTSGMSDQLDLDQRPFPLLVWAAYITEHDYFDKGRLRPRAQLESAIQDLGLHTPEFFGEVVDGQLVVTVRSQTRQFSMEDVDEVMEAADLLEQVLAFTQATLDLEDEPLHELEYAAINGFLAPLDPHTILLTPEQHADLGVKTRGSFGGIGAEIRPEQRRIVVVRVLPGSPAEKHGLQAGDVVLEIGGQSTVNLSADEASELIRGPVGTKIELHVRRGEQTITLEVTRDTIKIESVRSTMLPDRVGYVSISSFQKDTAAKVEEAIGGMTKEGELAALVIDVRGNSGGLLTQAAGILDQMETGPAELVIVHSAQGRESEVATDALVVPEQTAVVVLVDESSASASEILAGSVKHLERGLVVGRGSFGKGTVQMLKEATPYGRELALKLTVAEYRVTGDRRIQGVGVRPHLELVPVNLSEHQDVAAYYDDERFERRRERAQTAHLPSAIYDDGAEAFVGKPPPTLRFLDAPLQTGGGAAVEAGGPEELRDAEIRIAHELARAVAGKTTPDAIQATLEQWVEPMRDREDARIAQALGRRKLDWQGSPGTASDVPLAVEVSIDGPSPIPAGEAFTLRVKVRNEGDTAAQRVHAITDCDQDELDGIEVLMGRIEPGASVERSLRLHLMPWRSKLSDHLRVDVHAGEPEGEPDGHGEARLEVVAIDRPRFAFDYWIVDDPALVGAAPKRPKAPPYPGEKPFAVEGNGDGVLQPGERVLLAFEVRNDGPGAATEARAILRNLSGTQGLLEEGVVELGKLGSGKRATGAFGIEVSATADPAQPLELDLAIGDGYARESVRHKMRLRVVAARPAFAPEKGRFVVEGEGARAYNAADASAAVIAELEAGARIEAVGRAGEWVAVGLGKGRRAWVPVDRLVEGNGAKASLERAGLLVDPPRVAVQPMPVRVAADHVVLTGSATHPRRVRDVVVRVKPDANGKRERKIFYLANAEPKGAQARSLDFETKVPLEPGNNRVVVIVRDGDKVERRRDFFVHRD